MKFVADAVRTFWWPVPIRTPDPENAGKIRVEKFEMLFEAVDQDEALAMEETARKATSDRERVEAERSRLKRVCKDWREVVDEKDNPVPFTPAMLEKFIQYPWNRVGIYQAYAEAMAGEEARLGN